MTEGARLIKESKYVTTLTVKKIVEIPIANYLFFFLKSLITYWQQVIIIAITELALTKFIPLYSISFSFSFINFSRSSFVNLELFTL